MVLFLIVINFSVCSFSLNHFTSLTDDDDINRQVRSLYCSANQLKSAFSQCSFDVKIVLYLNRIVQISVVHICGVNT